MADPFNPGQKPKTQAQSLQSFISSTPRAGYVWDPQLALYIDPNTPANLRPKFSQVSIPRVGDAPLSVAVPNNGDATAQAFMAMLQSTGDLTPKAQAQVPSAPATGDMTGGWDQQLFSPTNRPNEPATAGAMFGAGPAWVRRPGESDSLFRQRVAQSLLAQGNTPLIRSLVTRLLAGE